MSMRTVMHSVLGAVALLGLLLFGLCGCSDTNTSAPNSAPANFQSSLVGGSVLPNPVVTGATATVNATINEDNTLTVVTTTQNLATADVTSERIYFGAPAANNAAPLFTVFDSTVNGAGTFANPNTVTLSAANFTPDAANNVNSFNDAMQALRGGNAYVVISTTANPNGEIRGQFIAQ